MAGRQYPYIKAQVPWSDADWEYIRGVHNGLPLLMWNEADRTKLATFRQLRARGLRPSHRGDVVALLMFRCGDHPTKEPIYANLDLVRDAKPVHEVSDAKRSAIEAALAARRICPVCESYGEDYIQRSIRMCTGCEFSRGWEHWDARHDLVIGEPTLSSEELETLPTPGLNWEDPGPDVPEVLTYASPASRPMTLAVAA
jgi:hypothetical protein